MKLSIPCLFAVVVFSSCVNEVASSDSPDALVSDTYMDMSMPVADNDVENDTSDVDAAHTCTSCDDGNVCTVDSCALSGECTHVVIEDCTPCISGDDCILMNVSCFDDNMFHWDGLSGKCLPNGVCETYHKVVSCDDGNPCTTDDCMGEDDSCEHIPVACDDGNPCTTDECQPETGCGHQAIPNCFNH